MEPICFILVESIGHLEIARTGCRHPKSEAMSCGIVCMLSPHCIWVRATYLSYSTLSTCEKSPTTQ